MSTLVLLITILDISIDRARRAASNDVIFGSGTGGGCNISKKYFFTVVFVFSGV
jgi:hypothetical protein